MCVTGHDQGTQGEVIDVGTASDEEDMYSVPLSPASAVSITTGTGIDTSSFHCVEVWNGRNIY